MSVRRPSPDRLVLRGYGPLAGLLAVLLMITIVVPSKSGVDDAEEVAVSAAGTEAAAPVADPVAEVVSEVAGVAGTPVAGPAKAAARGKAAAVPGALVPQKGTPAAAAARTRAAAAPAAAAAAAAAVTGARSATNCAGGAKQDKISAYSPGCMAFTGDNGGVTFRGVTKDTITIAMRERPQRSAEEQEKAENSELGKKAKEAGLTNNKADNERTFNTLLAYFNKTYQLYGRKVKIVKYQGRGDQQKEIGGSGQEAANADALKVGQEIKAFGDLSATTQPYLDALVRQKVLAFGGLHLPASYYQSKSPYAWGQLIDCTTLMTSAVDLLAKRFPAAGKADRSGSAKMREKPRKYGLLVPDDAVYAVYAQCINEARPKMKAAGIELTKEIKYALDFNKLQQETPNMAAQLKQAGVTTLLLVTDPLLPFFLTGAATQQDFWPEWFVTGTIGTDIDLAGQFYDQDQWQNAYGQSYLTALGQGKAAEAYRAYKTMRQDEPTTTADFTYQSLLMLFIGLQQAGPNLTPVTFQKGMYAYGPHAGPLGQWSFGPSDYTPTDDAREVYYDRRAISAFNSKPGRWVVLNGGKRYRGAMWPAGAPSAPIPAPAAP